MLLFSSTTAAGSIKSVAPLALVSWTMPGMLLRYSAFTGTTKRPLRWVMMESCRIFWLVWEDVILFSTSRTLEAAVRIWRRI